MLTSVLAIATTQEPADQGGLRLAVHAAGFGIPFLITTLVYSRSRPVFRLAPSTPPPATVHTGTKRTAFGLLLVTIRRIWIASRRQDLLRAIGLGGCA
jgi:cytochrome c biogenesis protein CcdA